MERLHYIDNLKGFLILLVILGHCIQATDMDYDHNVLFRYIYSFHMPLFMCVSGFVSYKPNMKWQTVRKRFKQLMIPFLSWAVVSCCIRLDLTLFLSKIMHPDTGLWFLWALFFIVLLMKLSDSLCSRLNVKLEYIVFVVSLLLAGIMVTLKFKLFGFQFIAWYLPFYAIGYFGRKYQNLWEKQGHKVALCLFVLFLFMAYWWMRKDAPLFLPQNSHVIYNYVYKFAVAIVAIAALVPLFRYYIDDKMLMITKLGGVTLGIYAIYQTILAILQPYFDIEFLQSHYGVYMFILSITVLAISYLCYMLINSNRYLSLLFLGK